MRASAPSVPKAYRLFDIVKNLNIYSISTKQRDTRKSNFDLRARDIYNSILSRMLRSTEKGSHFGGQELIIQRDLNSS